MQRGAGIQEDVLNEYTGVIRGRGSLGWTKTARTIVVSLVFFIGNGQSEET